MIVGWLFSDLSNDMFAMQTVGEAFIKHPTNNKNFSLAYTMFGAGSRVFGFSMVTVSTDASEYVTLE